MRLLAVKRDCVTLNAFGAEDDAEGQSLRFEHRALLDVQLEVGGGVVLFLFSFGEAVDVNAAAAESVFEADAVFVLTSAIGFDGVGAGEGGGAEQAAAEAGAFFIGEVDETNGGSWLCFVKSAECLEGREDAEAAVKPAAVGDRVKVAAEDEGFFGVAWEGDPAITGGVSMVLDEEAGEFGGQPVAGLEPGVGPGDALGAVFVAGEGAQFFEFGNGALGLNGHQYVASRRSSWPRPRSPMNWPSFTCTLPRTVTTLGRPSMAKPSKPL